MHWNWVNGTVKLDTQCDDFSVGYKGLSFKDLTANTTRLPYVPSIVKELGLFPTGSEDKTEGYYWLYIGKGERFPRRGGSCGGTSSAGLGCVSGNGERGDENAGYGGRSRSL